MTIKHISANTIANTLRKEIITGMYQLHERLPAERQLAQTFGVARGTVREALYQLEQEHIVYTRKSSGTYVVKRPTDDPLPIIESTSPLELVNTRLVLEPQITRLAVLNATSQDISQMAQSLHKLENAGASWQLFSEADEYFHRALAEATHNALLIWMHDLILQIRSHRQWQTMKERTLDAKSIQHYNQQHQAIFDAVKARNVDLALEAMYDHLQFARDALVQAGR